MKILGNRILVSRIEDEEKDGFQTVEVQDSFLYKGKVEQVGLLESSTNGSTIKIGDIVLFAKYSPHTQTVPVDGQDMKIIRIEDIIAVE